MEYQIVADSCCDLTKKLREELKVHSVPLILRLGEQEYLDDAKLDLPKFMQKMKACTEKIGSAAPAPGSYAEAYEKAEKPTFVVTLSSELSGSHASAVSAKSYIDQEKADKVHIFDSKSASAGELLIVMKIQEYIRENLSMAEIIEKVNAFIAKMKTYFVLENYDNLQKNGRLGKITSKLVSLLNIRLVMGSDGNGKIRLFGQARGEKQILEKMLSLIADSKKETEGKTMVISHCNNPNLAQRLEKMAREKFNFGKIHVVPTGGLSSLYADEKGIIMAF